MEPIQGDNQNSGVGIQNSGDSTLGSPLASSPISQVVHTENTEVSTSVPVSNSSEKDAPQVAEETVLQKAEHAVVEKTKEYAPVVRDFSVKWGKKGWSALKENSKVWFKKLDAKMDEIVEGMNKKS